MAVLNEVLLLPVFPKAAQELLHGLLVLAVSVEKVPCEAPGLADKRVTQE